VRENRKHGSEGGERNLPDPYREYRHPAAGAFIDANTKPSLYAIVS
jgi:hypothetical protein